MRRSGPAPEELIGPSWALPDGRREEIGVPAERQPVVADPPTANPTLVAAAAMLGGLAVLAVTHRALGREWGVLVTVGMALAALIVPTVLAGSAALLMPRHRIGNVVVALFGLAALAIMVAALAMIDV